MPTSKSLTSIDDEYRALLQKKVAEEDYKWLLDELLSYIHNDVGHYTKLAGHVVSFEDAIIRISEMRLEIRNLFRERRH
jgi:hypothetical protein